MKVSALFVASLFALTLASTMENEVRGEVNDSNRVMKRHPQGFFHVGDDGVYRSWSPDGVVLDYKLLSPEQIGERVASRLLLFPEERESLHKTFYGIDGRLVTDMNQIMNPSMHLWPRQLADPEEAKRVISQRKTKRDAEAISMKPRSPVDPWHLRKRLNCNIRSCEDHEDCLKYETCVGCDHHDLKIEGHCRDE